MGDSRVTVHRHDVRDETSNGTSENNKSKLDHNNNNNRLLDRYIVVDT